MYHSIRAPSYLADNLFKKGLREKPHNAQMVTVEYNKQWRGLSITHSILTYVAWLPWNTRKKPIK